MRIVTYVFALLLSTSIALAQGTASAPTKAPAPAPASKTKAAPAKKQSSTGKTPFAKKPTAPAPQPVLKPAAQETKPAAAVVPPPPVQQAKPYSSAGKRDPFLSVVQVATSGGSGGCSGGKRCLIINQITLRGIVKSDMGWIAVVENPGQKTYFLRVNDSLLNGFVARISDETVVFKENVVDALGHQSQREVVKYVSAPAV